MVVVRSLLIDVGVTVLTNRAKRGKLPSGLHLFGLRLVLVILEELIAEITLVHLFLLRPVFEGLKASIFRASGLNLLHVTPVLLILNELIAELQKGCVLLSKPVFESLVASIFHLWRLLFLELGYSGGYGQIPIERLWNK